MIVKGLEFKCEVCVISLPLFGPFQKTILTNNNCVKVEGFILVGIKIYKRKHRHNQSFPHEARYKSFDDVI